MKKKSKRVLRVTTNHRRKRAQKHELEPAMFYEQFESRYDFTGASSFGLVDMDFDDPYSTCEYANELVTRFGMF
jgi:hypothetical protein